MRRRPRTLPLQYGPDTDRNSWKPLRLKTFSSRSCLAAVEPAAPRYWGYTGPALLLCCATAVCSLLTEVLNLLSCWASGWRRKAPCHTRKRRVQQFSVDSLHSMHAKHVTVRPGS